MVKTHAREDYESARFNDANLQMLRFAMRWRKAQEIVTPAVETVASLGIVAALIYAWHFNLGVARFIALQYRTRPPLRSGENAGPHQYPHAEMPRGDDQGFRVARPRACHHGCAGRDCRSRRCAGR